MLGNNAFIEDEGGANAAMGSTFALSVPGDGSIVFDAQAVTFDYSNSAAFEEFGSQPQYRSLHDLVSSNGYRLRRLVGKLFTYTYRDEALPIAEAAPICDVSAGFIVCRTDDLGTPTTDFETVNPLNQDSANDPWIWRRRWLLGNYPEGFTFNNAGGAVGYSIRGGSSWPWATWQYGSVQDGGHIDQKTARVITGEERLFFVVAARTLGYAFGSPGTGLDAPLIVQGLLDLRAVASLRYGSGNRRNASR